MVAAISGARAVTWFQGELLARHRGVRLVDRGELRCRRAHRSVPIVACASMASAARRYSPASQSGLRWR